MGELRRFRFSFDVYANPDLEQVMNLVTLDLTRDVRASVGWYDSNAELVGGVSVVAVGDPIPEEQA